MRPGPLFRDRREAGEVLARLLAPFRAADPVVVGLTRGGIPVAYEVARELDAPLDACVVRKLGAPMDPELGIGAVSEDDAIHVDRKTTALLGVEDGQLAELVAAKRKEVEERIRQFRHGRPPVDVRNRTVLLVDDGIATGGTCHAAIRSLRSRGARHIVLAVPVGSTTSLEALGSVADEVVCPHRDDALIAVGLYYDDFEATTDDDVVAILELARIERERDTSQRRASERVRVTLDRNVRIPAVDGTLEGRLTMPPGALGIVVFAHGSGSGRLATRNLFVAGELQKEGLGTLLLDLLTAPEEREDARTGKLRFDVGLLASRLVVATDWLVEQADTRALPIAYFGASTGAAAALVAAAERPRVVRAVVLRGGRTDLAARSLGDVHAPTLLVVGGADPDVLRSNREALSELGCVKELEVLDDMTHSFEEPGALDHVARSAARWLLHHLAKPALESAG